jgi:hypothetical protein
MTSARFALLLLILPFTTARRGALVRDGMSSKAAYDNPMLGQAGDITMDPDVVSFTSRCANWKLDPPTINECDFTSNSMGYNLKSVKDLLGKEVCNKPLRVTFRSKTLSGGKRPNWMRATAMLGNKENDKSNKNTTPVRAVWTCSNVDADTSMTFDELNSSSGRNIKKEIGKNVLEDNYEDCLKRLYGKYVELEVLLPRSSKKGGILGGPPASLVYRVPINKGQVNPFGMVSKSRATVTLYPKGRTLAAANASGRDASSAPRDLAIPLGLTNVHLPLGPALVDPSWARGRKVFWKGRSVGLV